MNRLSLELFSIQQTVYRQFLLAERSFVFSETLSKALTTFTIEKLIFVKIFLFMQLLEFTRLYLLNRVGLMKIKGTSNTYLLKVSSLRRLQKSISANSFPI